MSIPKEKLIIFKIREILGVPMPPTIKLIEIRKLIDSYEDPGYIEGPVIGEPDFEN